ncbi:PAS domain-containing protein, partial [Acinetobacter baumannii]
MQPEILKLREAITKKTGVAVTFRNYRKDGRLFWNELRLIPFAEADGPASHFIGLMRDVTRAQVAAEQLDRAEQL